MNKLITLIVFISISFIGQGQNQNISFLMYDENMVIQNIDTKVKLSFDLAGTDKKNCIYNFEIDNISKDFNYLKFEDISIKVSDDDLKDKKILNLGNLSKYDYCDIQYLFADTKNLYLLKKEGEKMYKYRLIFQSSQRGWSLLKN